MTAITDLADWAARVPDRHGPRASRRARLAVHGTLARMPAGAAAASSPSAAIEDLADLGDLTRHLAAPLLDAEAGTNEELRTGS